MIYATASAFRRLTPPTARLKTVRDCYAITLHSPKMVRRTARPTMPLPAADFALLAAGRKVDARAVEIEPPRMLGPNGEAVVRPRRDGGLLDREGAPEAADATNGRNCGGADGSANRF